MSAPSDRSPLRHLSGVVDLPLRIGAVEKRARGSPDGFVAGLEALVVSSARGAVADADVVLACVLWILGRDERRLAPLRAIARRDKHSIVCALLSDAPPHRGLAPGGRLAPLPIPETARPVRSLLSKSDGPFLIDGIHYEGLPSLFEQMARAPLARRVIHPPALRRAVARLARHHSPFTIGRLLDDPSMLERDAVVVAARRPTTPAIVKELTSRPRWMLLPSVRAALVSNPCTPTRVSLLLSVTCLPRLRGIAATANVHDAVRELARLVDGRLRA